MNITIPYKIHQIHWTIFGGGKHLLLALHGFGDTSAIFKQLPSLAKQFTIYAPDLPFHGKTQWNAPSYTAEDMQALIQQALAHSGHTHFSVMGFSYGARILLTLLPNIQAQLAQIYLLAPDGIQARSGRAARLTPLWLRHALVRLVEPPDRFFAFLHFVRAKHWLPSNTYNFLHLHLSRPNRRKRTFGTWLSLTDFPIEPRLARQRLQAAKVSTTIYLGKKDPIISMQAGHFIAKDNPSVQLHFLDTDHFLVGAELDALLRTEL